MKPVFWIVGAAAMSLSACAGTPDATLAPELDGTYRLDPAHASIIWRIDHANGLSKFVGRFDAFDASLDFDPLAPQASALSVTIEAASVNTGLPDFDAKLAGAGDVFDADNHPQITFRSTSVEVTGPDTGVVTGDLTLRGRTAPVSLDVAFNGTLNSFLTQNRDVVGFSATGTFDRTDFGADAWVSFGVGAEIDLLIEAEFIREE